MEDWQLLLVGILGICTGVGIGFLIHHLLVESTPQQILENLEEWEIVEDEQGNLKKIIVHRTVKS